MKLEMVPYFKFHLSHFIFGQIRVLNIPPQL